MNITQLLEDIREKEAEASIDVASMNPGIQSTAEGLRRSAKEEVVKLTDLYKHLITQHSVIIAVSGDGAKKYAEIAKDLGWLTLDFQFLTERLAESLKNRTSSAVFGNQEWWLFLDELNQLKIDFKISNLPQPMINHTTDAVYEKPIKKAIDNLLKKNYNFSLHSAVIKRLIGDKAFEERFDKEYLPVVLYNCTGVDQDFLPKPISVISVEEDIGVKEVEEHIKNAIQIITPKAPKKQKENAVKVTVSNQVKKPRKVKETKNDTI